MKTSNVSVSPRIAACLAAVAVQVPMFGLLDAYPLIFDFDHTNLRKLFTLESLLIINLVELLISASFLLVVFGLPLFALLRFYRLERNWSFGLIGFVIAATPDAINLWPWRNPYLDLDYTEYRFWIGQEIPISLAGAPTTYAWADYFIELTRIGVHGLAAGLVFYWVWRAICKREIGPVRGGGVPFRAD